MVEGLEVVIKYRGAKHNKVAAPATPSAEFAILKKDLAHLRVHSPSQKNVRRVNGSFILHWPMAGTSPKVEGLADSLHTRWFKLCSDDPEARKLRDFLSIESITLTQDGILICSTVGPGRASQDAPPGTLAERLTNPLMQQPGSVPTISTPAKPQPPPLPPPRVPPSGPRSDRQQPPHLKRRLSSAESSSGFTATRQKLDMPEAQTTHTPRPLNTQLQPSSATASPRTDRPPVSSNPGDETKGVPQVALNGSVRTPTPTQPIGGALMEVQTMPASPDRESGEMTPRTPLPTSGPSSSGSGPGPGRQPPPHPSGPGPSSPYPSSSSSGNGDAGVARRRDRDVGRLMRELWDTRRQLTAMQAREQVILDDLERLGSRPDGSGSNLVSRDELSRVEADLRTERSRRVSAERALSDVERECRAPFVVPALYQAFMSISELSS